MTPSEDYAHKHKEAVALIRQHAPTRLQDSLIELLRPAIALSATRAEDAQIPLGASKFGGAPDVPADFVWPMWNDKPLGFLAQINLEETAPFAEGLLPESGLLSFFFNWEDWSGVCGESCQIVSIGPSKLLRADSTGESEICIPCGRFNGELYFELQAPVTEPVDEELEALFRLPDGFLTNLPRPESWNKMLGYGDVVANAPLSSFRHCVDHQPWHLLLQLWLPDFLGSGHNFGDTFILYFSISPDDLRERRFHESRFEVGAS